MRTYAPPGLEFVPLESSVAVHHDASMNADALVNALAAKQGGIVLADQALELGLTDGMIRHRVRSDRWSRAGSRAYRIIEMKRPEDLLKAATVALPGAVVSHESAAEVHAIPMVIATRPTVMVHTRTTHTFPGVAVRRCHDLAPEHLTTKEHLPVTNLPRTIVDLAARLSARHLAVVVDDLVAARRVTLAEIAAIHTQVARRGKPGSARLREILGERAEGHDHPGSVMESMGWTLLVEAGLPRPRVEYPIPWQPSRRFDLAYPKHKLAIEWDSRRWHSQVDAFDRDRKRDRLAVLHRWRILRFTWSDIVDHPREVVESVRTALGM